MDNPLFNPAIAIIRGKLGTWIYFRNRWGQEARHQGFGGITVPSPAQTAWTNLMKVGMARWNANLTEAQRIAWRAFTEQFPKKDQLGQVYAPSGQNRHAALNAISWKYAGAWLDDPPMDLHCHQPTAVSITTASTGPDSLIVALAGTLDADEYAVFSGIPYQNPGFHNCCRIWRYFAHDQLALPRNYDATADYVAEFGALEIGQRLAIRFQIANAATGTISQPIWTSAIIA